MTRNRPVVSVVFALLVALAGTTFAALRQSSSHAALDKIRETEIRITMAEERYQTARRQLAAMEERAWVLPQAQSRLGMLPATAAQLVFLLDEG